MSLRAKRGGESHNITKLVPLHWFDYSYQNYFLLFVISALSFRGSRCETVIYYRI
jgi:hypothetical protein